MEVEGCGDRHARAQLAAQYGEQLSFAVFPLVIFTPNRAKMGALVAPVWLIGLAGFIAVTIAALNVKLLLDFVLG